MYDLSAKQLRLLNVSGFLAATTAYDQAPWNATGGLQIGRLKINGAFTEYFPGDVDEVRVYDRVHPDEIATMANRPAKLFGRWTMNEGTGASVKDASGRTHPLTAGGGVTWGTDRFGVPAATVVTNGSTGYLATAATTVETDRSFTVTAWVNQSAMPATWSTMVAQDGTKNSGFYLQYTPADRKWAFSTVDRDTAGEQATRVYSRGQATLGRWTHLVGVYDAAARQIRLYVDGELAGASAFTGAWPATGPLQVGRAKHGRCLHRLLAGRRRRRTGVRRRPDPVRDRRPGVVLSQEGWGLDEESMAIVGRSSARDVTRAIARGGTGSGGGGEALLGTRTQGQVGGGHEGEAGAAAAGRSACRNRDGAGGADVAGGGLGDGGAARRGRDGEGRGRGRFRRDPGPGRQPAGGVAPGTPVKREPARGSGRRGPSTRVRVECSIRAATERQGSRVSLSLGRAGGIAGWRARVTVDRRLRAATGRDWSTRCGSCRCRIVRCAPRSSRGVGGRLIATQRSEDQAGHRRSGVTACGTYGWRPGRPGPARRATSATSLARRRPGRRARKPATSPGRTRCGVPPALGGPAPKSALSYSSQRSTGGTAATNNQPSWVGEGFDCGPATSSAATSPAPTTASTNTDDDKPATSAGAYDNATLSLNGKRRRAGPAPATTQWRLEERRRLPDRAADRRDAATATTTASTGGSPRPTAPSTSSAKPAARLGDGKPETNSTWTVPVFGNDPGEPCYSADVRRLVVPAGVAVEPRLRRRPARQRHGLLLHQETEPYGRDLNADGRHPLRPRRLPGPHRVRPARRRPCTARHAPAQVVFDVAERCLPRPLPTAPLGASTAAPRLLAGHARGTRTARRRPCNRPRLAPTFWRASG